MFIIHSSCLSKQARLTQSTALLNMLIRTGTGCLWRPSRCPLLLAAAAASGCLGLGAAAWLCVHQGQRAVHPRAAANSSPPSGWDPRFKCPSPFLQKQRFNPPPPHLLSYGWMADSFPPHSPAPPFPAGGGAATACWVFNRLLMGSIPSLRSCLEPGPETD